MKPTRALSLGVLGALAASAAASFALNGTGVLRDVAAFPLAGVVALLCAVIVGWTAKALKFRLLVARLDRSLPFGKCLAMAVGCDFAFVASPGGVAGYPSTVLLFGGIGIDAPRALAVAAADQLLDLAFFAVAMPLALAWALIGDDATGPGAKVCAAAALVAAVALVAVGSMGCLGRFLSRLTGRLPQLDWPILRRLVALDRHWQQFRGHLRKLCAAPPKAMVLIACVTSAQWLARYATLGIALAWLGKEVPYAVAFLVQAVALHAGQWTGVPGGVGATDAIMIESLRPWLSFAPLATALVVWRMATFHLTLLAGGGACVWLIARKPNAAEESFVAEVINPG